MRKILQASLFAMLTISSLSFFASADFQSQSFWIRMKGMINDWGGETAFGWINTHVRMLNVNGTYEEWAVVHATWTQEPRRLNCTQPPTENFTFVFYAARFLNTTEVELDYSGYDLFISGLWNVTKITANIFVTEDGTVINFTRTVEPLLSSAEGELCVSSNWHQFELTIDGAEVVSGLVHGAVIRYMEIKICDVDDDGGVDLIDLVKVAKRYGTAPGLFNYDHNMDFNCNEEIDVGDLTTVAANIEV